MILHDGLWGMSRFSLWLTPGSQGVDGSHEAALKLRLHVSNKRSSIATLQIFIVVGFAPENKRGRIMRRLLKAW